MSRLARKERKRIEQAMYLPPKRDSTWVGFRPVLFGNGREDAKGRRREDRLLCRKYCETVED
ncbi:MAG: hypothetical protein K6G83_04805 [Lachnospiraceae bacterium]|nr:hypothetical protein [Lachnospiraceae bacterium]